CPGRQGRPRGGARAGRRRWPRILPATRSSSITATKRMGPVHRGQIRTDSPHVRFISVDHGRRRPRSGWWGPTRSRHGAVLRDLARSVETLRGLRFERIEDAQRYLDRWEAHWADTRIHGTTKHRVAVMFAEEKPHLRGLPVEPFRYYQF